jgi:putative spermidine/putrescine transport system ATP-binding protein
MTEVPGIAGRGEARPGASPTDAIQLLEVSRAFGALLALDRVSLSIAAGEFFALLGPSGSGKTTCLRLVAGFDHPTQGRILLDGLDVTGVPPFERNVNTVFQDYALFPHMTVADNVAYGPRVRGAPADARRRQALEMLELVRLSSLADRTPAQLSGGQKQRVALARALINRPRVLLLDEPLGALDLRLREEMQSELKSLQQRLGITFVYVTHDQGEALSMADRIAVFRDGRIEQLDTPRALYVRPRTAFVARFVGSANVVGPGTAATVTGAKRPFAIRPELIDVLATDASPAEGAVACDGTLEDIQYHGATSRWHVRLADGTVLTVARVEGSTPGAAASPGSRVRLGWSRDSLVWLADE